MRFFATIVLLTTLTACVHRGSDVELEAIKVSPPAGYSTPSADEPYLRTWADFEAYRSAAVEASHLVTWDGERAVPGQSIAIRLSEGSRIENTTAHPQCFDIWLQIPQDIAIGRPYKLRRAADRREISRTRTWGSDPEDRTDYSLLKDGEMTLTGMQGYDVPKLRKTRRSIATITVTRISDTGISFHLLGRMPIVEDMIRTFHYHVNVDRTYEASFKPIER